MIFADDWKDFELIDAGDGEKLERWDKYILRRPDPQAIWPATGKRELWESIDAHYHRSNKGGGNWEYKRQLPEIWTVSYSVPGGKLTFNVKTMGFKHTGLFPEQAVNWKWMIEKIQSVSRPIKVLNLFAYTGGATVACAYAGAEVCHVDAAKGMVQWAKENVSLSGLADRKVRFLTDDVIKFVKREIRRGNQYDAVIMDPPSYGRGPKGEKWSIENDLYDLVMLCTDLLSNNPLFFLINSYTTGLSPSVLDNVLSLSVKSKFGGRISTSEIGLKASKSDIVLPCGAVGRWEA